MSIAEQAEAPPGRAPQARAEQRVVLHGIDWPSYTKFLEAVGERRIRLTYDRGTLEIMTLSGLHEWWRRRLGFVLPLLGSELNVDVQGGSTTLRREDVDRGLEPDEGFYVRHAAQVVGPRDIDLTRDPPPDLAIEVEISRSSLGRMAVYAALGVPEVWRFDGESLTVHRLRAGGAYEECASSPSFPLLPLPEFVQFLQQTQGVSGAGLIRPFQA